MTGSPQIELPGVLQEIADLIGARLALALADACGGTEIYIPENPRASFRGDNKKSNLATRTIGVEAMVRLAGHFGGGAHIEIPIAKASQLARRNARLRDAVQSGASKQSLARREKITTRHIRRICNGTGGDARQIDLFDRDEDRS